MASAGFAARYHDTVERCAQAGLDVVFDTAFLAGDARGDIVESLPWSTPPRVAVFVEHGVGGELALAHLTSAVVRGAAMTTRWGADDSRSALAVRGTAWNRWELSRDTPLAEWIYTDGVATHCALALDPSVPLHLLLGMTRGVFARLRAAERTLRVALDEDLQRPGLGPLLRWMVADAAPSARLMGGRAIPQGAGRYLAWRLTEQRVANIGIRDAIRAAV